MRRLSTWVLILALAAGGYGGWYWLSGKAAGVRESTLEKGLMPERQGFKKLDSDSDTLRFLHSTPEEYIEFALTQPACPQVTLPKALPRQVSAAYFGDDGEGTVIQVISSGSKEDVKEIWAEIKEARLECTAASLPSGIGTFPFDMSPDTIAPTNRLIENPSIGVDGGPSFLYAHVGSALIGDEVIVTFIWAGGSTSIGLGVKARTRALRHLTRVLDLPASEGPRRPVPVS